MVYKNFPTQIRILKRGYALNGSGCAWEAAYLMINGEAIFRVIPSGYQHGLDDTIFWFANHDLKIIPEAALTAMDLSQRNQLPFDYFEDHFNDTEWLDFKTMAENHPIEEDLNA